MEFCRLVFVAVFLSVFRESISLDLIYESNYVKINDSFIMSCSSDEDRVPYWEFNGRDISNETGYDLFVSNFKSTLFIAKLRAEMLGKYSCSDGLSTKEVDLINYNEAIKVSGCKNLSVWVNTAELKIPCQVQFGKGITGRLFWLKNNILLIDDPSRVKVFDWGLQLNDVTEEDQGVYSLVFLTENGIVINQNVKLSIMASPTVYFYGSNLGRGTNNSIHCVSLSTADTTVYFNGTGNLTKLDEATSECCDYYTTGRKCESTVTVVPRDSGALNITCTAINEYGQTEVVGYFNSLEVPSEPVIRKMNNVFTWDNQSAYRNDPSSPNYVSEFVVSFQLNNKTKEFTLSGAVRSIDLEDFVDGPGLCVVGVIAIKTGVYSKKINAIFECDRTQLVESFLVKKEVISALSVVLSIIIAATVLFTYKLVKRKPTRQLELSV